MKESVRRNIRQADDSVLLKNLELVYIKSNRDVET